MRGLIGTLAFAVVFAPQMLLASELDRAIKAATAPVVKLYGLGAGAEAGYGTGLVVSSDGLVITVLSLLVDARVIRVTLADGSRCEADLLYRDASRQLVLLKLRDPVQYDADGNVMVDFTPLPPLEYVDLSRTAQLRTGDWLVVAGNSFKVADGAEPMSIAHGIFAGRSRLDAMRGSRDFPYSGEVLMLDAVTSNPGAPGSSVVSLDGTFVGIVGRNVTSNLTHTHVNYAIPQDVLNDFLQQALHALSQDPTQTEAHTSAKPAEPVDLGIHVMTTGYRKVLPFVERMRKGSPAERAGVRVDDLIVAVNGRAVKDSADYEQRLSTASRGQPVELTIRRGREMFTISVEPEPSP